MDPPPSVSLHVWLLGGFRATWDGQPVTAFESDKARALFCYLLLEARPIRREQLVGLFWGEQPEARARGNLSRVLSNLRDLFPACLSSDRAIVALTPPAPPWVDAHVLAAAYRAVQQAPDATAGHAALRAALELYRGPLLAGFSLPGCPEFEEWLRTQQEHWHTLALTAWEWQTAYHRQREEWEAAAACARRALELEPWRESAQRQLMLLLALQGEREAALHQYEQCRRILAAELGLAPAAETEALRARIAAATELDAESALAPAQPAALPFVGRGEAHGWLLGQWAAARRGAAGLTLIAGEAGVGKSRLVHEALRFVAGQGGHLLSGRCYEFNRAVPYQAVAEALRPRLTQAPPAADNPLRRLLRPDAAAPAQRAALFAAVAAWLPAPGALFLDDLQWADADTLDLLHYLVRNPGRPPCWLIAAYRPEECPADHPLTQLAQALNRDGLLHTLTLAPLAAADVAALAARLFGAETRLGEYLFRESAGNPFLIGEALETLRDRGVLRAPAAGWEAVDEPPDELPLSLRAQEMILQRVRRLDDTGQYLLTLAAAHGRPFDADLLAEAGECAPAVVAAALDEWQARRLARPVVQGWDLAHDNIRAALYQAVPPPLRRLLHARLAAALETREPQDVSALAYHCDRAQHVEPAARYLLQAGDQARLAYAHEQAIACYQRGLELTDEATLRYALLSGLESSCDMTGRRELQRRVLDELAALAENGPPEIATPQHQAETALRQANYAEVNSDYAGTATAAQRAIAAAMAAGDEHLAAEGHCWWGAALRRQGDMAGARVQYEQARVLAERVGADATLATSLEGLANIAWARRDYRGAEADLTRSLTLRQQLGDKRDEAIGHNMLGIVRQRQGDYAGARCSYTRGLELRRAAGDLRGQIVSQNNLGTLAYEVGANEEARQAYAEALRLCQQADDIWGAAIARLGLGWAAFDAGDWDTAQQYAAASLSGLRQANDPLRAGQAEYLLGRVAQAQGNGAAAGERFAAALTLWRAANQTAHIALGASALAHACAEQGRTGQAYELLEEALAALEREPLPAGVVRPLRAHWHGYSALAALGDPRADRVLASARALWQAQTARLSEAAAALLRQIPEYALWACEGDDPPPSTGC